MTDPCEHAWERGGDQTKLFDEKVLVAGRFLLKASLSETDRGASIETISILLTPKKPCPISVVVGLVLRYSLYFLFPVTECDYFFTSTISKCSPATGQTSPLSPAIFLPPSSPEHDE